MSASFDPNHVTKLGELYSFLTGIWTKCKNMFAAKSDLSTVATSGSYNDLTDKPTIPTVPTTDQTYNASSTNPQSGTAVAGAIGGVRQVPASTSTDSGKVLKVNASGTPEWDTAPSGLPASTSADEGKVLKVDSNGDPEWGAAPASQVQADWTESDSSDPSYIQNKPVEQTLVAGTNITITEANNQVTIGASFTQAQADWNQSDSAAADYIKNKPSIPAAQVQSDWNQSDNTQVDFIKNKPANIVQDASYVHTDNNFTTAEKTKLSGIEAGAEVNVQSDWSEANSSADDYIKNKPDLSIYAEKSDLATVATTGDYDDLQNKPTIPAAQVQSDYGQTDSSAVDFIKNKPDLSVYAEKSELSAVATSGDYDDLQNKPSIPAAQVQSDWSQSDSNAVDFIKNKPQNLVQDASYVHTDNNFTTAEKTKLDGIAAGAEVNVQADWNQSDSAADDYIKNKPTIPAAQVQSDWNQSDNTQVDFIKNKPTIPTVDQTYNASSANAQSGTAVAGAIANVKQVPASTSGDSGKVLTVNSSGSPEWQTGGGGGGTVDQTYDSTSANAQSGTAVAGALATVKQVPASVAADEGKVLSVNSSGNPEWSNPTQADWSETNTSDPSYIQNKPNSVPIAAGTGISATVSGGSLVLAADETVLYSTTTTTEGQIVLSEAPSNFEKIAVYIEDTAGFGGSVTYNVMETTPSQAVQYINGYYFFALSSGKLYSRGCTLSSTSSSSTTWTMWFWARAWTDSAVNAAAKSTALTKIVGINRKPVSN